MTGLFLKLCTFLMWNILFSASAGQNCPTPVFQKLDEVSSPCESLSIGSIFGTQFSVTYQVKTTGAGMQSVLNLRESMNLKIERYAWAHVATDAQGWTNGGGSTLVNDGQWHDIGVSYDGAYVRFYVDGVLDGQLPKTGNIFSSGSIFYGCRLGSQERFSGDLANLRIYNQVLTDDQFSTCPKNAQQWVESTGICHAQDASSQQILDLPLSWEQCKTSCEGNPDCVSFWHSHLKGPAHNSWSVRCVQTKGSRGCNEQEKQMSIQNYKNLGLDCCLDLTCPNNQYIHGIAYANIWICANTWTKEQFVPLPPTMEPTLAPSANPTLAPSANPTLSPSANPTLEPTVNPTLEPTVNPTAAPSEVCFTESTGNTQRYDVILPVELGQAKAIKFTFTGRNDAHVGFFSAAQSTSEVYEIVIGGWGNSLSVIRESNQGHNQVSRDTQDIVSATEPRDFWASAVDGYVQIGYGHEIGRDVWMDWQDPTPHEAVFVGLMTGWGATGEWEICIVDPLPPTVEPTLSPTLTPTVNPTTACTDTCVSTPGWTIDSNPVTTCGWMEHICGPMRRGECLEHGGNVKCQWGYVTSNYWANYGPFGSPVSHCCNCQGFQMPENFADNYWTTAPTSWVWNGNWKNTHTSTGTELPICEPARRKLTGRLLDPSFWHEQSELEEDF